MHKYLFNYIYLFYDNVNFYLKDILYFILNLVLDLVNYMTRLNKFICLFILHLLSVFIDFMCYLFDTPLLKFLISLLKLDIFILKIHDKILSFNKDELKTFIKNFIRIYIINIFKFYYIPIKNFKFIKFKFFIYNKKEDFIDFLHFLFVIIPFV